MRLSQHSKSIVGLDIDAGSLAAVEVVPDGGHGRVAATAMAPLDAGLFADGDVIDADALGGAVAALFADNKLSRRARIGLANQRVAVRSFTLPPISNRDELDTAVRFQAQEHIPMAMDQAVLEYQVVGEDGADAASRTHVVAAAARRDMVERMLSVFRRAGVQPVGIDVSAFALMRALRGPSDATEATLYLDLGAITNIAIGRGETCLFTRVSSHGVGAIAERLAERRELTLEHARQWLIHVGLSAPVESLEGDAEIVRDARTELEDGAMRLATELRHSLEFYAAIGEMPQVTRAVDCGSGSIIPGLRERLSSELDLAFSAGRPAALAGVDDASAARLALPYGLALEA